MAYNGVRALYHKYNAETTYREILKKVKNEFPQYTNTIGENINFASIHEGKRCFIFGNGPSLSSIDFSLFQSEYVFTVNRMAKNIDFIKLRTNYHFWVDPQFFEIDPTKSEDKQLLDAMKNVNTNDNKPVCFYPIEHIDFVKKYNLDAENEVHFIWLDRINDLDGNIRIDFTKQIPGFHTVVQYAIAMAIYMGFSEIYLLGCDTTGILTNINEHLKKDEQLYAYEISEDEKKLIHRMASKYYLEEHAYSFYMTLKGYHLLANYCERNGIKLINCSSETLIDTVKRMRLNEVLTSNTDV